MNIYSIYKIVNKINGKVYVGFTSKPQPIKRWIEHISCSKLNPKTKLHKAIKKYGKDNFEFSVIYQSREKCDTLLHKEPYFIKEYNSFSNSGYNMTCGGEGSLGTKRIPWNKGKTGIYSKETLEKLSKNAKNRKVSPRLGTKHSLKSKNKMSVSASNRVKHPSLKRVTTPHGTFNSMKAAAVFYKKSPSWMTKQLKLRPLEFKLVVD